MICRDRNLIFIHIPKTGGTSIEDMLWPGPRGEDDLWQGAGPDGRNAYQTGGLQHLTAKFIRDHVGEDVFNACYRFALVRDPVDRLISQFNYLNTKDMADRLLGLGPARTFSDYLDGIAQVAHVQWMPQMDFLYDDDQTLLAQTFKLEHLDSQFSAIAAKTGLTAAKPLHVNATPHGDVPEGWVIARRSDLTHSHLARISEMYRRDFEDLNYAFPTGVA